jgi:hypothetical protein
MTPTCSHFDYALKAARLRSNSLCVGESPEEPKAARSRETAAQEPE